MLQFKYRSGYRRWEGTPEPMWYKYNATQDIKNEHFRQLCCRGSCDDSSSRASGSLLSNRKQTSES